MSELNLPTELFIDGAFVAGEGEAERVLNPATGGLLVEVPEASAEPRWRTARAPGASARSPR